MEKSTQKRRGITRPIQLAPLLFACPATTFSVLPAAILLVISPSYGGTLAKSIFLPEFFPLGRGFGRSKAITLFGAEITVLLEVGVLSAEASGLRDRFLGGDTSPFPSVPTKLFLGRPRFLDGVGSGVNNTSFEALVER